MRWAIIWVPFMLNVIGKYTARGTVVIGLVSMSVRIITVEFYFDWWDRFCYRQNQKYEQGIRLARELDRKGGKS